jgi:fatty acid-binding protein DegV
MAAGRPMTIRIVADGTCDLPPEIIRKYGIPVIPLYIHAGGRT